MYQNCIKKLWRKKLWKKNYEHFFSTYYVKKVTNFNWLLFDEPVDQKKIFFLIKKFAANIIKWKFVWTFFKYSKTAFMIWNLKIKCNLPWCTHTQVAYTFSRKRKWHMVWSAHDSKTFVYNWLPWQRKKPSLFCMSSLPFVHRRCTTRFKFEYFWIKKLSNLFCLLAKSSTPILPFVKMELAKVEPLVRFWAHTHIHIKKSSNSWLLFFFLFGPGQQYSWILCVCSCSLYQFLCAILVVVLSNLFLGKYSCVFKYHCMCVT